MSEQPARFCEQCGAKLEPGVRFCEECGAQVVAPPPTPTPPTAASRSPTLARTRPGTGPAQPITWETDITLLTNPLIVRQLALVVTGSGLFMALLLSFIFGASGDFDAIPPMLLISLLVTAGLGVLVFLVTLVFFGNRTRVRYTLDSKGALWSSVDGRAITASRLAILAGILGRNPTTAGAGTLAAVREQEFVRWKEVVEVKPDRRRHMITLRNSWRPIMLLVCQPEDFDRIESYAKSSVGTPHATVETPRRNPFWTGIGRTILVLLAATPLFALSGSYFFDLDLLLPLILLLFALATVWLIPLFGWVVIGCAAVLAVQLTLLGLEDFGYLYAEEQVAFLLAYVGLAYLSWFSWRALRGRVRSALMEG